MKAFDRKLVLEDGSEYPGYGFGASCERICGVVFNTSMTATATNIFFVRHNSHMTYLCGSPCTSNVNFSVDYNSSANTGSQGNHNYIFISFCTA